MCVVCDVLDLCEKCSMRRLKRLLLSGLSEVERLGDGMHRTFVLQKFTEILFDLGVD